MSETKWSPEPWRGTEEAWDIEDADGGLVADVFGEVAAWDCSADPEPNRRRIVACVNACAGIPTEALEAGALGKALDAYERTALHLHFVDCGIEQTAECRESVAALRALGRLP